MKIGNTWQSRLIALKQNINNGTALFNLILFLSPIFYIGYIFFINGTLKYFISWIIEPWCYFVPLLWIFSTRYLNETISQTFGRIFKTLLYYFVIGLILNILFYIIYLIY